MLGSVCQWQGPKRWLFCCPFQQRVATSLARNRRGGSSCPLRASILARTSLHSTQACFLLSLQRSICRSSMQQERTVRCVSSLASCFPSLTRHTRTSFSWSVPRCSPFAVSVNAHTFWPASILVGSESTCPMAALARAYLTSTRHSSSMTEPLAVG